MASKSNARARSNPAPLDRRSDLVLKCEYQIWHMRSKNLYQRSAWFRKIQDEHPEQIRHGVLTIEETSPARLDWAIKYMDTGEAEVENVAGFGSGFFGPYMKGYELACFLGMEDLKGTVAGELADKLARVAVILQVESVRQIIDDGLIRSFGITSAEFYAEYALAIRQDYDREKPPQDDPMREALLEFGARTYAAGQEDVQFRRSLARMPDFESDAQARSRRIVVDGLNIATLKCGLCDKFLFEDGMRHLARAEPGNAGGRGHVLMCSVCYDRMWASGAEEEAARNEDRGSDGSPVFI
ncbi:uncharacterized protein B0I36DRAFT_348242 [Microdochium trichocladiopsis]|uniref:Uncharacterized protein n=1 Tax=Microdochium trichocladiopsis TaxID=1682393 RepID=A0A9P9BRT2_9PEZI|nr:uncharacterized protein B0I36DRAFT_348242 [Microdochium trichocladiopsis]KAH7033145.1 hypothetical protein B0I36DRAFT_348242 [Microdochium trichocladiopsis]